MILDVFSKANPNWVTIQAYGMGRRTPRRGTVFVHRGFQEAIAFLLAFQEHAMARYETVTTIRLDSSNNGAVKLAEGPEIRLGRHPVENLSELEKVIPLLEQEDLSRVEYIDLQYDDVIVKRRKQLW